MILLSARTELIARFDERRRVFNFGPYLYVIGEPEYAKIGWAVEPQKRLMQLQMGNARRLEVLTTVPLCVYQEKRAHDRFAHLRVAGEWFRRTPEIEAFVRELKRRMVVERRLQRRFEKVTKQRVRHRSRLDRLHAASLRQFGHTK